VIVPTKLATNFKISTCSSTLTLKICRKV